MTKLSFLVSCLLIQTAKFVDDNRAVLIQDVSEVMAVTEELGDMVHSETYSKIEAKATTQDKMRVLYQTVLRSGGVTVKAAFYDALKKHHSSLMDRLGRTSAEIVRCGSFIYG